MSVGSIKGAAKGVFTITKTNKDGDVIEKIVSDNVFTDLAESIVSVNSLGEAQDMPGTSLHLGWAPAAIIAINDSSNESLGTQSAELNREHDVGEVVGWIDLWNNNGNGSHLTQGNRIYSDYSTTFNADGSITQKWVGEFFTPTAVGTINKLAIAAMPAAKMKYITSTDIGDDNREDNSAGPGKYYRRRFDIDNWVHLGQTPRRDGGKSNYPAFIELCATGFSTEEYCTNILNKTVGEQAPTGWDWHSNWYNYNSSHLNNGRIMSLNSLSGDLLATCSPETISLHAGETAGIQIEIADGAFVKHLATLGGSLPNDLPVMEPLNGKYTIVAEAPISYVNFGTVHGTFDKDTGDYLLFHMSLDEPNKLNIVKYTRASNYSSKEEYAPIFPSLTYKDSMRGNMLPVKKENGEWEIILIELGIEGGYDGVDTLHITRLAADLSSMSNERSAVQPFPILQKYTVTSYASQGPASNGLSCGYEDPKTGLIFMGVNIAGKTNYDVKVVQYDNATRGFIVHPKSCIARFALHQSCGLSDQESDHPLFAENKSFRHWGSSGAKSSFSTMHIDENEALATRYFSGSLGTYQLSGHYSTAEYVRRLNLVDIKLRHLVSMLFTEDGSTKSNRNPNGYITREELYPLLVKPILAETVIAPHFKDDVSNLRIEYEITFKPVTRT